MSKIRDLYDNCTCFIKNIWLFRKVLYQYRSFDYHGLLMFNKEALKDMYQYQSTVDYFVSVNRDKTCKRMKAAIGAYERLLKDEYGYMNTRYLPNKDGHLFPINKEKVNDLPTLKMDSKYAKSILDTDLEIISKFHKKYLLNCWQ